MPDTALNGLTAGGIGSHGTPGIWGAAICDPNYKRQSSMKRISIRDGLRGLATVAVTLGMMAAGITSRAETVLSNLTATISSTDFITASSWLAQSFDTNAQAWTLNSVSLSSDGASPLLAQGNFFAFIHASTGTGDSRIPGASLGQLIGTDNPDGSQVYSYTAESISLDPSSRYWVVMGVSDGTSLYNFNYADVVAATGVWSYPYGGRFGGIVASSSNNGATWSLYNYGPFLMEFDATSAAVPEIDPASFGSAISLVLGSLGLIERKRRLAMG